MPPNEKAGRVVFIGNIPYGTTEETIVDTLGRVGHVLNFRLVYDKDTGRPKGFGFAEFADADAAASAVRNLNDYELSGRKLRVDWSNDNGAGDNAPTSYSGAPPVNGQSDVAPPVNQSSILPPLPPGRDPEPNLTCTDAISRTLSTLPPPQLIDILSQMRGLTETDPEKAKELLRQAPQLAFAIFQAILSLGLVDQQTLTSLVTGSNAPAPTPAPPQPPPFAAPPQPPQAFPGYPPQPVPTPPQYAQPQAPPYGAPPPAPTPTPNAANATNAALFQQVMSLSPEQLALLPADARAQVLSIRHALNNGQFPPVA